MTSDKYTNKLAWFDSILEGIQESDLNNIGHDLDKEKLKKELGDVLWYLSTLASMYDIPLEDVAKGNIDKLRNRYPEGWDLEKTHHLGE